MPLDRISSMIQQSSYISRDLSWLQFNCRVLDQAKNDKRNVFERLKFLAITSSNLDEFFMIRVGSLYNYIDYGKERIDYSGLREVPFRKKLYTEAQKFVDQQNTLFEQKLMPLFSNLDFEIVNINQLDSKQLDQVEKYFIKTIFPMLTPMTYDSYHTFPILMNKLLIFGVVTKNAKEKKDNRKVTFIQIPANLPRFYEFDVEGKILFLPIDEIIRKFIHILFRNVEILSINLFRITRNNDFSLEESDDMEANFIEEIKRKLKTRKTGRVVRIEIEEKYDKWMMKLLKGRWEIDDDNIFKVKQNNLFDYTGLWQIIKHNEFKDKIPPIPEPVAPITYPELADKTENIFEILKERDILMHHPYNSFEPLLELIEKAAEDTNVLAIKMTIYRLAKDSRIINALLKALENGIHVSVLFELKARFDEENNIREAQRLQKAGCFVIYGLSNLKTDTKLLMIVRRDRGDKITRYVHMSSGNYNEETARLYTDIGLLSTGENYANDVSEFFNVLTGHSFPHVYKNLITAPNDMRDHLLELIETEAKNAANGEEAGIAIKINSLEDQKIIDALYKASQANVPVKLIVRGICCLRPGRKGLSENIEVISIVGNYLEHSRIFYFHNKGKYKVIGGSADMMVRSFDRRLESLFYIEDETVKKQLMNIIRYNLNDNMNAYSMQEDGSYKKKASENEVEFNIHELFYSLKAEDIEDVKLFGENPTIEIK